MLVRSDVRITTNQDGAVILDPVQGLVFSLNTSALRMWELTQAGLSEELIADRLVKDFAIPKMQALADVKEFVNELQGAHLLRLPGSQELQGRQVSVLKGFFFTAMTWWREHVSENQSNS
jgi:hypothetical protein